MNYEKLTAPIERLKKARSLNRFEWNFKEKYKLKSLNSNLIGNNASLISEVSEKIHLPINMGSILDLR